MGNDRKTDFLCIEFLELFGEFYFFLSDDLEDRMGGLIGFGGEGW